MRADGSVEASVVEVCPVGPSGAPLSVEHVASLVGTDAEVDVGALAGENVSHAAEGGASLAVFGPDECIRGLHLGGFSLVLHPGVAIARVLCWPMSVWQVGFVEALREVPGWSAHGREEGQ